VKVFHVTVELCWGSEFSLTASLATELHQLSSERVSAMIMLPLSDGCEVHLSYTSKPHTLTPSHLTSLQMVPSTSGL